MWLVVWTTGVLWSVVHVYACQGCDEMGCIHEGASTLRCDWLLQLTAEISGLIDVSPSSHHYMIWLVVLHILYLVHTLFSLTRTSLSLVNDTLPFPSCLHHTLLPLRSPPSILTFPSPEHQSHYTPVADLIGFDIWRKTMWSLHFSLTLAYR